MIVETLTISAAFTAALLVASWGRSPDSPRRLHLHRRRIVMFWWLPLCVVVLGTQVYYHNVSVLTFGIGLWILGTVLWLAWPGREQIKANDALANYASGPGHCGQCEYDLTGNTSGICPECGWQIPKEVPPQKPIVPWTNWTKCWRIEHLDDWRKKRNQMAIWAAAFGALAVIMGFLHSAVGIALGAQMCLGFLINVGRATAYGRRERCHTTD
jgi:hypothetical protein